MSKNLRPRKGAANLQEEMLTDSNLEELTQLVKSLAVKIDKLDSDSQSRHDVLCVKLQQLESITANLSGEINDLKQGLEFTNKEVEMVKATLSDKPDSACVATLERKLEDLENRSKRNNIVIWNIPEGAEKDSSCQDIVSNILNQHMKLEGDLEIMRAHRTNIRRQNIKENTAPPLARPVHVYLLRYTDKQYILRSAASALKDNPFLEANLYISDDVSKKVRDDRKRLKESHINEIRAREEVDFAYIPWSVPARILYKVKDSSKLKSFFLPDE